MAQEAFGGDSFGNSRPGSPSGSFHYYGQGSSKKHAPVQRDWAFSGYSSVEDVVAEITQGKDENDFIGQAFLHNNNFYIMAPNKQGYLVAQRRGILEGSEIYDISNQNRVLVEGENVQRMVIPVRRLSLTKFKINDVLRN